MATNQLVTSDDQYASYWDQFRLFPSRWANSLFSSQRNIYFLLIASYALVLWSFWPKGIGFAVEVLGWFAVGFLLAFQAYARWAARIPAIFEWLRRPTQRVRVQSGDFDSAYLEYLREYQQSLQTKKYPVILSLTIPALAIAGIITLIVVTYTGHFTVTLLSGRYILCTTLFFVVWGYLGGYAVWTLYTTMRYIKELCVRFEIEIQSSHPDRCGGLASLGDFCFAMSLPALLLGLTATIVSLGGFVVASIVEEPNAIIFSFSNVSISYRDMGFVSLWILLGIIVFIMPIVTISFFMPLWAFIATWTPAEEKRRMSLPIALSNWNAKFVFRSIGRAVLLKQRSPKKSGPFCRRRFFPTSPIIQYGLFDPSY